MVTNKVGQAEVNILHIKVKPYTKQQKESHGKKGKCFRCGREGHYVKDKDCPARNEACRKCQKTAHFQSQCITKGAGGSGQDSGSGPQSRPKNQKGRRVNGVEVDTDDDYAFVIEDSPDAHDGCVNMCIGGVMLQNVLIDSGSTCNLIDKATWGNLKRLHIKCESEKVTKKIYSYGSQTPLKTVGKFSTVAVVRNPKTQAEFFVIDGTGRSFWDVTQRLI